MSANRLGRYGVIAWILRSLSQIGIPHLKNDFRISHGMIGGAVRAGFSALPKNLSALVEVVLRPGIRRKIRNVIELVPETIQLLRSFVVEDELNQRKIVPVITHRVVIPGAQQPAFVLRVIGEIAAAF